VSVLLITTDQQRWDTVSAFGAGRCQTPNIDRLAARGVRYSRAYTPHPLCQPARASILSGRYASRHGVWNNGVDLAADLEPGLLSSRLAGAGWRTGFCGKGHFSTGLTDEPTGRPENLQGSEGYDPATWDGPYVGFDWNRLVLLGHYPATALAPPQGMHYTASLYAGGEAAGKALVDRMGPNPLLAPQTWYSDVPYEHHATHFTGESARQFLRDCAPGGRPFFLWVSFADPHHPLDPPRPFAGTHDPADVTIPAPPTEAELAAKPPSQARWGRAEGDVIEYLNPGWLTLDEAQRRQMTAAYFDMIAACPPARWR
jgi:arylsulfatase A-like enzyme